MPSRPLTVIVAVTATALAGCSSDRLHRVAGADHVDAATSLASPSPSATTSAEAGPAPSLGAMQDALVEADTGRVRGAMRVGGVSITHTGAYRLSELSARMTTWVSVRGGTTRIDHIAIDDMIYMQIGGFGSYVNKCWFTIDQATAAATTGEALPAGAVVGAPVEVLALSTASERDGGVTIDLYNGGGAFTGHLPRGVDVDFESTARLPVELTTGDRTVTLTWTLADVVEAATADGATPPSDTEAVLSEGTFEGTIWDPGTPVLIEAPPRDRRVRFDPRSSEADLVRDLEVCESRLNGVPVPAEPDDALPASSTTPRESRPRGMMTA